MEDISRRKSGGKGTTPRTEPDAPEIVSGTYEGYTSGAPLTILFRNTNTRSGDYGSLESIPRPGHADLTAAVRFDGFNDPRGGGAFSGKDSSKVDRSAAYAARHIAKNMVASGLCDQALVQIAYAIGIAEPVGFYVNTEGTSHVNMSDVEIARRIKKMVDLRPYSIVKRFGLTNPIFEETASYGHFGRQPEIKEVEVYYKDKTTFTKDNKTYKKVELFGWEKLDLVENIKKEFGI